MTNKEAIKILQEQQAKFNDEYIDYGGVNEAYKLAIKALEDIEEWDRLIPICASNGVIVYKVKENNDADSN